MNVLWFYLYSFSRANYSPLGFQFPQALSPLTVRTHISLALPLPSISGSRPHRHSPWSVGKRPLLFRTVKGCHLCAASRFCLVKHSLFALGLLSLLRSQKWIHVCSRGDKSESQILSSSSLRNRGSPLTPMGVFLTGSSRSDVAVSSHGLCSSRCSLFLWSHVLLATLPMSFPDTPRQVLFPVEASSIFLKINSGCGWIKISWTLNMSYQFMRRI